MCRYALSVRATNVLVVVALSRRNADDSARMPALSVAYLPCAVERSESRLVLAD